MGAVGIKMNDEKLRLLIKVCELYYSQGLNQQEIAKQLNISRPQVSRNLAKARSEGIVSITINNPFINEKRKKYEEALVDRFGLDDAVVVNSENSNDSDIRRIVSEACAKYLTSVIRDHDIIGVMAGTSVQKVCQKVTTVYRNDLRVVPTIGGWGTEGTDWHANANAKVLGENLKGRYYVLHAPSVVTKPDTRETFLNEPDISSVLNIARQATISLMGIGEMSHHATIVRSGVYSAEDLDDFKSHGAVASILSWFIDKYGQSITHPSQGRTIGLGYGELKKIPKKIAVAYGIDKAEAILAAILGKWLNVLVTDTKTVKAILEMESCVGLDLERG